MKILQKQLDDHINGIFVVGETKLRSLQSRVGLYTGELATLRAPITEQVSFVGACCVLKMNSTYQQTVGFLLLLRFWFSFGCMCVFVFVCVCVCVCVYEE
jgi:hypothetical protein